MMKITTGRKLPIRLGPARRGPPRPRGSAFTGEGPCRRKVVSARTPVDYLRNTTRSGLPDTRLMESKFYLLVVRALPIIEAVRRLP